MDCAFSDFLQVCIAINAAPVALHEVVQESLCRQIDRKIERLREICENLTPDEEPNAYLQAPIKSMERDADAQWAKLDAWAPWLMALMVVCAIVSVCVLYIMECQNFVQIDINGAGWVSYLPNWLWALLMPFVLYCGIIIWTDFKIRALIRQKEKNFKDNAQTATEEGEKLKKRAFEYAEKDRLRKRPMKKNP